MSMHPSKPISEIIEDNTVEFFLSLGKVNGSEVCDCPEVKYVFSGCGYNRIMRTRFQVSVADTIVGHIVSRLDFLGIDALWYITPTTATELSSHLERYGFVLRSKWMSMAMDLTTFSSDGKYPAGLEIYEADDVKDLDAWANVVIGSYGLDDEIHRAYGRYLITRGNDDSFRRHHFLGLMNGKPVATTVLFRGKEAAGIYWVGTLPEARKRGTASAMIRHTLLKAKTCGYKIVTLNASVEGHSLYRGIGFTDYYTENIFYRKSCK